MKHSPQRQVTLTCASVQAFVLPLLLRRLDQRRVLVVALAATTAEMALFALAPAAGAAVVFLAVVIGAPLCSALTLQRRWHW